MKSKILMCLVLASCSTMQVSENKVKDRYTDIVKSTEIKDIIQIQKDDVYVCDYRYDKEKGRNIYFRYCDEDGKPLNDTVELERAKYELRDGYISYVEIKNTKGKITMQAVTKPEEEDTTFYSQKEQRVLYPDGNVSIDWYNDSGVSVKRDFCSDGRIINENIRASYYSMDIYNEVKKDGVKLNAPLIVESINKSELDKKTGVDIDKKNIHLVNGKRVTDGSFEIADCGDGVTSYTIKDGKYVGDYVYDSSYVSTIKKYEDGKIKSETHIYKDNKIMLSDVGYYNKYEVIMDKDKYTFRYYLDDKLIEEY